MPGANENALWDTLNYSGTGEKVTNGEHMTELSGRFIIPSFRGGSVINWKEYTNKASHAETSRSSSYRE